MALQLPPAAEAAHQRLTAAVTAASDSGTPAPCTTDPERWTGGEPQDRRAAAEHCLPCPALEPCRSYAQAAGETWLVWGGQDRTRSKRN